MIFLVGTVHAECVGFQCNVIRFMSHGIINVFVPSANADVYSASLPGAMTNVSSEVFNHLWGMSVVGNQIIDYVKKEVDVNKEGTAFNRAYKKMKKDREIHPLVYFLGKDGPLEKIKNNITDFKFLVPSMLGVSEDEVKKLIDIKVDYDNEFYAPWWYATYGTQGVEECMHKQGQCECKHENVMTFCADSSHVNEETGKYDKKWYKYSSIYGTQPTLNIHYIMDVLITGKLARYYYFIAKYSRWNVINSLFGIYDLNTINASDDSQPKEIEIKRRPFPLLFRIEDYPVFLNCSDSKNKGVYHYNDLNRYNLRCDSSGQLYSCGVGISGLKRDPCDTIDTRNIEDGIMKEYYVGCPPHHFKEDHIKEYDSKSDATNVGCWHNLNNLCGDRYILEKIKEYSNMNGWPKYPKYPAEAKFCIKDNGEIDKENVEILTKMTFGKVNEVNCEEKKERTIDCVYYGENDYKFSVVSVDGSDCNVKLEITAIENKGVSGGFYVLIVPDKETYTFSCDKVLKKFHYSVDGGFGLNDICCYAVGGVVMHTKDGKYFCKGDGYCDCDNGEKTINSPDCHACECKKGDENGCWTGGDCHRVDIGGVYHCHKCVGTDSWVGVGKCDPSNLCLPCDTGTHCDGCTWRWKTYTECSAYYTNNYCNLNINHKRSASINCCSCTQESQTVSCTGCCELNDDGTCKRGQTCNDCTCYC